MRIKERKEKREKREREISIEKSGGKYRGFEGFTRPSSKACCSVTKSTKPCVGSGEEKKSKLSKKSAPCQMSLCFITVDSVSLHKCIDNNANTTPTTNLVMVKHFSNDSISLFHFFVAISKYFPTPSHFDI